MYYECNQHKQLSPSIRKIIKAFSSLVPIETIFINKDLAIETKSITIEKQENINNFFKKIDKKKIYAYPFIFDYELEGFFLLISTYDYSNKKLLLLKNYLDCTIKNYLKLQEKQAFTLKFINIDDINYFFQLITQNYSIFWHTDKKSTPSTNKKNKLDKVNNCNDHMNKTIRDAIKYINDNFNKNLTLNNVSQVLYISPAYLSRILKKHFNTNFINYINMKKIALAQEKLLLTNISINKLIRQIGFTQSSYFTKIFKQKTRVTPLQFRKNNPRIKKIYTISRDLNWNSNLSVYDISKNYFIEKNIDFKIKNINGYPYIYSIGDLNDNRQNGGWIYMADFVQPATLSNEVKVGDKSIIQWMYTDKIS
ncbi:MAG: helix-turn-helix transcriptional regulator [Lactobacillaceae bacterium]